MILYASDHLRAYDLLELAAREVWGWQTLPELARTQEGKPYFPALPDHYFNLSHSEHLVLCALDSAPVGVDIQVIKRTWRPGLPKRVCSERELAWLEQQDDLWAAFTQLWTLKECQVKYTGTGLQGNFRSIPIPIPECGQWRHQQGDLWFGLYSGTGWQGAVCGEYPPPETILWK